MKNPFFNNVSPRCDLCAKAKPTAVHNEFLCPLKGVVGALDYCKKFDYDPLKRVPREPVAEKQFTPEDFMI